MMYNITGSKIQPIAWLRPIRRGPGKMPIEVETSRTNKPSQPEKTKTRTEIKAITVKQSAE